MLTRQYYPLLLLLLYLLPVLQGCFPFLMTGAVATVVAIDRRTAGSVIEDEAIEVKASKILYTTPEIRESSHIKVISYNQIVLIVGETPSEAMRDQIGNIVKKIKKVTRVFNEVTIAQPSSTGTRISDTQITSKVKTRLFVKKDIQAHTIKVVTSKGVVYLMGLVTEQEGEVIGNLVRRINKVQKVVKIFQYIPPEELHPTDDTLEETE